MPSGVNVLGGRLVLPIKIFEVNEEPFKTQLFLQGHKYTEKNIIVQNGTNISQCSVGFLLAFATFLGFRIWSRDVSQKYLQSAGKLMKDVYVRKTKKIYLSSNKF